MLNNKVMIDQNTFWVIIFTLRYVMPRNQAALRIVSEYIIERLDTMTADQKEILKQEITDLPPIDNRYSHRYAKELVDKLEIK